jgi:hypothetical protein
LLATENLVREKATDKGRNGRFLPRIPRCIIDAGRFDGVIEMYLNLTNMALPVAT